MNNSLMQVASFCVGCWVASIALADQLVVEGIHVVPHVQSPEMQYHGVAVCSDFPW